MPFTLIGQILRNFIFGHLMCRLIPYFQGKLHKCWQKSQVATNFHPKKNWTFIHSFLVPEGRRKLHQLPLQHSICVPNPFIASMHQCFFPHHRNNRSEILQLMPPLDLCSVRSESSHGIKFLQTLSHFQTVHHCKCLNLLFTSALWMYSIFLMGLSHQFDVIIIGTTFLVQKKREISAVQVHISLAPIASFFFLF